MCLQVFYWRRRINVAGLRSILLRSFPIRPSNWLRLPGGSAVSRSLCPRVAGTPNSTITPGLSIEPRRDKPTLGTRVERFFWPEPAVSTDGLPGLGDYLYRVVVLWRGLLGSSILILVTGIASAAFPRLQLLLYLAAVIVFVGSFLLSSYRVWAGERRALLEANVARDRIREDSARAIALAIEETRKESSVELYNKQCQIDALKAEAGLKDTNPAFRGEVLQCAALPVDDGYVDCWFWGQLTCVGTSSSLSINGWSAVVEVGDERFEGRMAGITGTYEFHTVQMGPDAGKIAAGRWLQADRWLLGLAGEVVQHGDHVTGNAGFHLRGVDARSVVSPGATWTVACKDFSGKHIEMRASFEKDPHELETRPGSYITEQLSI